MNKKLSKSIYYIAASISLAGFVGATTNLNVNAKTTAKQHKNTSKKDTGHKIKVSMSAAERELANDKYNAVMKIAKEDSSTSKTIMKADKAINPKMPFNKNNYENAYIYALNHPSLIRGSQGASGGQITGISDGLADFVQYQAMLSTKKYASDHNYSQDALNASLTQNNKKGYYYWYVDGFNDLLGGDNYDGAKRNGGQAGLDAYKAGLDLAAHVQDTKASDELIQYTKSNLNNTIFKQQQQEY